MESKLVFDDKTVSYRRVRMVMLFETVESANKFAIGMNKLVKFDVKHCKYDRSPIRSYDSFKVAA